MRAKEADLSAVLAIVREHRSITAKTACLFARNGDGSTMEPGKVMRLLRELERRQLVENWKRPGTRSLLWTACDTDQ